MYCFYISLWISDCIDNRIEQWKNEALILVNGRPALCMKIDLAPNWSVGPSLQDHIFNKILTPRGLRYAKSIVAMRNKDRMRQ